MVGFYFQIWSNSTFIDKKLNTSLKDTIPTNFRSLTTINRLALFRCMMDKAFTASVSGEAVGFIAGVHQIMHLHLALLIAKDRFELLRRNTTGSLTG